MKCIDDDLIQRYLDGEIKLDEKVKLEKHLSECVHCSERLEHQRIRTSHIKDLLNSLAQEEVARPPVSIFKRSPASKPQNKGSVFWSWKRNIVYGFCTVCVIALVFICRHNTCPKEEPKIIHLQSIVEEVDANRPITDQKTVLVEINSDGKVSYLE